MSCRVRAVGRVSHNLTFPRYSPVGHFTKQHFRVRATSQTHHTPGGIHAYYWKPYTTTTTYRQSGSGYFVAAAVLGIAIGGALFYPLVTDNSAKSIDEYKPVSNFDLADRTDSFLVMAPNTPPGRPSTLTPEQEGKLRELWTATMKVFGAVDEEVNGVETASSIAPSETTEKDGKKEKKKSRLHVFKRNKGDKGDNSEAASGASTPDISKMSLEDDKHGQNKEFKDAIANTAPEDLRKAFWSFVKMDHPDALLLLFLRARKWDVDKALIMMVSTIHWRMDEMHVDDDIMKNGEEAALKDSKSDDVKVKKEGEGFLAQLRMGKSYLHGLDIEGRPMCVVRARLHRAGEQSEASLERYTVYTIETARLLLRPPIDTATIVFDMTDFSMANMDYAPVKFMIKCFEANYPESLGTVLVYKAPWVFNAIWSIIKGWLDPVVAGKVHFAKNVDELEKWVPKNQIPKELGGTDPYEYSYPEPVEGENARMADPSRATLDTERQELVTKYEKSILEWIAEGEAGKSSEERKKERDTVAEGLRVNYWKLDPYVRARSLYDRNGLVGEDGKLTFYPSNEKENVKPTTETSTDDLD
ncbi:CRAL/TRIO domain-containing protein [Bimuria novae-zelandiae CBS 107.79]|uniref:CRAL/TRIO domain-containing protein n=1 Tax=Bimuria novae-zelandiae CBS 107.79 TaxID=1447943 RepID=A0A6A5V0C3_9PLEO|nr:CRAL/TRIO domain-containing protein [Bimuria novae-zelandiae CBS 107.79]